MIGSYLEEVLPPREPSDSERLGDRSDKGWDGTNEFPLQVRYPKTVQGPVTKLNASALTSVVHGELPACVEMQALVRLLKNCDRVASREYVVTIDHRSCAGDVSNTFAVDGHDGGSKGVVVRDNVGAAKRWKERQGTWEDPPTSPAT
eukprot:Skav206363  [mRNA]  locus=scaffold3448:346760:349168:- [translate_table: standard]